MLGKCKILIVLASGSFNKDLNNCIESVLKSSLIRLDINCNDYEFEIYLADMTKFIILTLVI